jgi:LTXXQ motif family protein
MDRLAGRRERAAAGWRAFSGAEEDLMAMTKGALAGAAIGALALATALFIAPIAAQDPGQTSGPERWREPSVTGEAGPRVPDAPGMRGPGRERGPGTDRDPGPGMMGRQPLDPDDPDITGPRGDLGTCQERLARVAQWRLERIQRLTRPTDEQRPAFEELRMASEKALDVLRAACQAEQPLTPPARMAAREKWLEARLQASKTVRPALESFYRLLSDEQKIRWSTGPRFEGRGAEERWRDREREGWRGSRRDQPDMWDERGRSGRDSRGFERGGPQRYRWRDDDRGGCDDRWRDQDRDRWGRERWREPRWRDNPPDERSDERR